MNKETSNKINIYQTMAKKDECYTKKSEADKLRDYLTKHNIIDKDTKIWMPFDNEISAIYRSFAGGGYNNIILSNLEMGLDFYLYEPIEWDIIITNPPFSGRTSLMKRLIGFNKPFIILQATQFFNNQSAVNYLCEYSNDFKLLLPSSRMSFLTYDKTKDIVISKKTGAAFYSFWLCYKTKVKDTFTTLKDNGLESAIERLDMDGNAIVDNHFNLFNI